MGKVKVVDSSTPTRKIRPALNPESRQNQLASLAVDLAEKQLIAGTASSQVITHFLKVASIQGQLELERLRNENELIKAKKEKIQADARSDELMKEALSAFRSYSGHGGTDEY